MPLDGLLLRAVCDEINPLIIGGRVDRINQPERDEVHIQIRSQGQNLNLLLCANPSQARLHLSKLTKPNPLQPPMFCMLLRKHLSGARALGIRQIELERIFEVDFETLDDLGDLVLRRIVVEIMGRHSNLILIDQNGRIIDAAHRVSETMSRVRQILPGLQYEYPPSQNKFNPLNLSAEGFGQLLAANSGKPLAKALQNTLMGFAPASCEQLSLICSGHSETVAQDNADLGLNGQSQRLADFFRQINDHVYRPTLVRDEAGAPVELFPFEPRGYAFDQLKAYDSICEAMDEFFRIRDRQMRVAQRKSALVHTVTQHLERCNKKSSLQAEQIRDCDGMETWRLYGELLTANLHLLSPGSRKATVINYYDPEGKTIDIPLGAQYTPAENAQRYFKRYTKAKTTVSQLTAQIAQTAEEIAYLEGQLDNLEKCDENAEISEIRAELEKLGYVRASHNRNQKKNKQQSAVSKPYRYRSTDGAEILVGKNNLQNDRLTLQTASPEELWLHVKDIPGSHVIVRQPAAAVSARTLSEAAMLAAWYSRGRNSGNVAVDYVARRHVRKPAGAKPGMVIYDHHHTIYVTPQSQAVSELENLDGKADAR